MNSLVSKRWRILAILVAIIVGASVSFIHLHSHFWGLPYKDSFTSGKTGEWHALGGTWEIREGAIHNNSDERGAKLLTGSANWQNYSLEADVELLGYGGDAGLIVRATDEEEGSDSYNGYYAGLRSHDNKLIIGRADHGRWLGEQTTTVPVGVHPFHWYHLKLIVVGCEVAAMATDLSSGSNAFERLSDRTCTRAGRIGLRSYSSGGAWRNVRAAAATGSDLRPPWWTAGTFVAITITVLVIVLIGQIIHSRMERWRLGAVLEERERLAHEMHDTIAQSFAGIGFQLQAIRNNLEGKNPAIDLQMDVACALVRHSHQEARRSIATLRPESLDSIGLPQALANCARRMANGGTVQVNVSVCGDSRSIPVRISDTLFRIGQEAIANAVRHASPSTLNIRFRYETNSVQLVVEDDGVGILEAGDSLGFGIRGMRKRADTISARFQIARAANHGTQVQVTAPLPPRFTMKHLAGSTVRHIRDYLSHAQNNGANSHSYRG